MQYRILFRTISNVVTHYICVLFLLLGEIGALLVGWILTLSIPILLLLGYYAPYFGERDALTKKLYSAGNPADVELSDQESVYSGFIALGSTRYLPFGIPVRITYSPGGNDSGMYRLLLNKVIIDGECVSACAWLFIMNPRACYTDNMVLRFHSWHRTFIRYKSLYTSVSSDRDFGIGWRDVTLLSDRTEKYVSLVREPLRSYLVDLPQTSNVVTPPDSLVRETYPERKCKTADE